MSLESSIGSGHTSIASVRDKQYKLLRSWLFLIPVQLPIYLWGGPGTGKTTVLKQLLPMMDHVAYVDCASVVASSSVQGVFECCLDQLRHHERSFENKWKPYKTCNTLEGFEKELLSFFDSSSAPAVYLVLDHCDALFNHWLIPSLQWLASLSSQFPRPLVVVMAGRRHWRQLDPLVASYDSMSLHFPAYTEEETSQLLVSKCRGGSSQSTSTPPTLMARNLFELPKTDQRERWIQHLSKVTRGSLAPLVGMRTMEALELDGFRHFYEPVEKGHAHPSKTEGLVAHVEKEFMPGVWSQNVESMLQYESIGGGSLPIAPSPADVAKRSRNKDKEADRLREKRMCILGIEGATRRSSMPRHDAALVVAGYLASLVPKNKDAQIFSQKNQRNRQTKNGNTVGMAATFGSGSGGGSSKRDSKVKKSFKLDRLLLIFRHVIDDSNFIPSTSWFCSVQSLVNAGFFERNGQSFDKFTDVKLVSNTPQSTVASLAEEIGYSHLNDVLNAQL